MSVSKHLSPPFTKMGTHIIMPAKRQSSSSISLSQNNGKLIIFHNANDFLFRGFQTPETGGFSH